MFFPNATITVKREVQTGVSDTGSPLFSTETLSEGLEATVRRSKELSKMRYDEAGQTLLADYLLTIDSYLDIRNRDIVYIETSTVGLEGTIFRVVSDAPYKGTIIKHLQCLLKFGTEDVS